MRSLADRLARGDDSAFAELYDACADRLHRYAAARLRSSEAASDVVQTVFLRAVKSRRRFRNVGSPAAYLFQIARNETTRAARRGERRELPIFDYDPAYRAVHGAPPEDAEALAAALARLAADDREIIELKLHGALTFAEIAAVVGRPPGTVATRYRRALESLRGWLKREFS
jgi:RNA polymerase sigma-70 factor (ECF subfamily)